MAHRDSEKHDRMLASLIMVLPNRFEGGRLIVRHGPMEENLNFKEAASGEVPCFAAFYADCEHEVQRVSSGVRLALAYNLVLKPSRGKKKGTTPQEAQDPVVEAIRSWTDHQPGEPLVFAMEHHYTQAGLSLDLLKGADRSLADTVVAAAEKANCVVHLCQVERHVVYSVEDEYGYGYGSRYRSGYRDWDDEEPDAESGDYEIVETIDEELSGTEWADPEGKKQPWNSIGLDLAAIVAPIPIENWKPTREEHEGYTGNAGNTLDRWYHRSAIVVWHRDHHFDVIASCGTATSIPMFCSMAAKLTRTPKKQRESAREDCIRFARSIIAQWPRGYESYRRTDDRDDTTDKQFCTRLLSLRERDTIVAFLSKLADQDQSFRLGSFPLEASREFGWDAFVPELKCLLTARPEDSSRPRLLPRDVEWLSIFCCDGADAPARTALGRELCTLAVERFLMPQPPRGYYGRMGERSELSTEEAILRTLVEALLAVGADTDLDRVIELVRASSDRIRVGACQVPALCGLVPWCRKRTGEVHSRLAGWLRGVRDELKSATAERPAPPSDWARPASISCCCEYCTQLARFLADPARNSERIPAREDRRTHLINIIDQNACDVRHTLDQSGRPYSLVLVKTNRSHERAVEQYEENLRLLASLPTEA